jgi:hypothetical protein
MELNRMDQSAAHYESIQLRDEDDYLVPVPTPRSVELPSSTPTELPSSTPTELPSSTPTELPSSTPVPSRSEAAHHTKYSQVIPMVIAIVLVSFAIGYLTYSVTTKDQLISQLNLKIIKLYKECVCPGYPGM